MTNDPSAPLPKFAPTPLGWLIGGLCIMACAGCPCGFGAGWWFGSGRGISAKPTQQSMIGLYEAPGGRTLELKPDGIAVLGEERLTFDVESSRLIINKGGLVQIVGEIQGKDIHMLNTTYSKLKPGEAPKGLFPRKF